MQDSIKAKAAIIAEQYTDIAERIKRANSKGQDDIAYLLEIAELIGKTKANAQELEEEIIAAARVYRITSTELGERLNTSVPTITRRWSAQAKQSGHH